MIRLIIFAVTMLLLSSICNGQGTTPFGANRAQDTSSTKGQLKLSAYAGASDTTILILLPSGVVKAIDASGITGTPSLQAVTDVGNVTTDSLVVLNRVVIATDTTAYIHRKGGIDTWWYAESGENHFWGKYAGNSVGDSAITNIGIGTHALRRLVKGKQNIVVGVGSAPYLDNADFNTVVGNITMRNATTASYNTVMGVQAGESMTNAIRNTFIGAGSGNLCTSCDYNTFLGSHAARDWVSGNYNLVMGWNAGVSGTQGSNNTMGGFASGNLNRGNNNTYFGSASGASMTSSGNTMMGYDCWGLDFTSNYQINFANVIRGFSNDTNAFMRIINDSVEVYNDGTLVSRANDGKQYFKQQVSIGAQPSIGHLFEVLTTDITPPGTVSVTASGNTVTGTGTSFLNTFQRGQTITANGETHVIATISSATLLTTVTSWTNSFNGAYTIISRRNFDIHQNGQVSVGNNQSVSATNYREFQVSSLYTDQPANIRAVYANSSYAYTLAPYTGNIIGLYAQPAVRGTNTQDWTTDVGGVGGINGAYISPSTNAGATGNLSKMVGVGIGMIFSSMTTGKAESIHVENPSGSATVTHNSGLVIDKQLKGATSNVAIKSSVVGNLTGSYFIYDSSTYSNYLTGTILNTNTGSTTAATYGIGTANTGLYQSAANRIDMTISGVNLYRWDNTGAQIIVSNNNFAGQYAGISADVGWYRGSSGNTMNLYQNSSTVLSIGNSTATWSGRRLGIGGAAPASAVLSATSTTQGFLPPVMTAAQAGAISSPAEGLMVYVTDTDGTFTTKGWWGWNGAAWERLNN